MSPVKEGLYCRLAVWFDTLSPAEQEILVSETELPQTHQSRPKLAADIQAILTVIGRRTRTYKKGKISH